MAATYTDGDQGAVCEKRRGASATRQKRSGLWQRVKPPVDTLAAFWTKINNDGLFNLAAMLAYNFLMSAFPILLVLFTIGGLILTATGAGEQALVNAVAGAVPSGTATSLLNGVRRGAGLLLFIGIVVAIFTGSRLFVTLEYAFGVIFRLRSRSFLRQNLMAIGMLLLYAVLIPILLLASIVPPAIVRALGIGMNTPVLGFLIQAGFDVLAVLFAAVLFAAMYIVVPNKPVRLREVWKGTLVAAALLVLYEALFPLYVSYFLHPQNFGATAGFAVVILVFFYYLAVILLLGAEINSWEAGQRQTAAPINALLHEVQAHNTTRGAAGPTAGAPQEDIEHRKGAEAMSDERTAVAHERHDHHGDVEPPKFAESGVAAPGYNVESQDEQQRLDAEGAAQQGVPNRRSSAQPEGPANARGDQSQAASARPLTTPQKRALCALLASVAVAAALVVRWVAHALRNEERPHAMD
ncbi:MAG TPA: YhjD/YihY/BrkB family envelope integrity protein [Ktedonobacterales bacterium]|nr:YhjD/YihY/BrkB family envelope integrity protein [Ktedonobacterales bacterium]